MNQDHLSAAEVAMFREDSFSSRSIEIGRHLLACKECRAKLPSVTPQEFRKCVLRADIPRLDESEQEYRFLNLPVLSFARVGAFAGFAVLLLAGIYFVGVQGLNSSGDIVVRSNEPLIETVFEVKPEGSVVGTTSGERDHAATRPTIQTDLTTRSSNKKMSQVTTRKVATKVPEVRNSETRGKLPCGGQRSVGLEARLTETGLLLRWNKVRGTVKLSVYLSDLDEKLIDHFETVDRTSHLVSAKLENETVYSLRLIVTLESGERIVSESQNFKVGDLTNNAKSIGAVSVQKKTAATVRCVEAKP